jgi:histidinol-phosphate aminotransferase
MLEENFRSVVPYTPGEQPQDKDVIKLNTNENPYPPSPLAAKAISEFDADTLRLYPDPASTDLVNAIAETYNVSPDMVYTGVGSDDVLALSFLTFFNSGRPVLFPDITYSFYTVWTDLFRIPYEQLPLKEDLSIEPEAYMNRKNGGIVLANPNAPTGLYLADEYVEKIAAANPGSVVIIDEAYADFADSNSLGLVSKYENVIVVRTFSKSRSMAGLRIGYAIGCPKLIKALNDVRYSFNSYPMTRVSQAAGAAVLKDNDYFEETVKKIKATREWTKKALRELGFTFPDSKTNFIFASPPEGGKNANELFLELKKRRIYVRHFNGERVEDGLRITIGTDRQMKQFIDVLKELLS